MLLLRDFLAMSLPLRLAAIATISSLFIQPSASQTYAICDPTTQSGCPADPALGGATSIDFRSGASDQFTASGYPTYGSDGVEFTIAQSGDSPTLISNWYIMFGKYEITMKAAPGQGIVSSVVLQSDDLDEIDWEWVGVQNDQGQTNYFGKGQTTTYDRGGTSYVSDSQYEFHTYGVEWTDSQITWSIDGTVVRKLIAGEADGQFPQTPCQLRIGAWSGGDPSNAEGTIEWAGGATDYSNGPYTMTVESVAVTDYSTGTQYTYGDSSGEWSSIQASGGSVNINVGGSFADTPAPASAPIASASGFLISGSSSVPSQSQPPSSTQPPAVSQAASCSGVSTYFNDKGSPITVSNCQPTGNSKFADKVAEIKQTTLTPTVRTSLPIDLVVHRGAPRVKSSGSDTSGGSKIRAQWVAGFGILLSAVIMATFLA